MKRSTSIRREPSTSPGQITDNKHDLPELIRQRTGNRGQVNSVEVLGFDLSTHEHSGPMRALTASWRWEGKAVALGREMGIVVARTKRRVAELERENKHLKAVLANALSALQSMKEGGHPGAGSDGLVRELPIIPS